MYKNVIKHIDPGIVHLTYVHMRATEERKPKHSATSLVISQRNTHKLNNERKQVKKKCN